MLWNHENICGLFLPEDDRAGVRAALLKREPSAVEALPTPQITSLIERIGRLLNGESIAFDDIFDDIPLDFSSVSTFQAEVYQAAQKIPAGQSCSYGDLAKMLGKPGASRAVGTALGRNPFPLLIPCHRVLAAGGKIGGFTAHGGLDLKRRLLAIESGQESPRLAHL